MSHNLLLCVESGNVGVKLIDLGNCFSLTGTDTSRISFEMQTLPFRAPEVQSTVSAQQHLMPCYFMRHPELCCMSPRAPHIPLLAHCASCHLGTLLCSGTCSTLSVLRHYRRTTPNKPRITTSASTSRGQRLPACTRLFLCLITLQCMSMCACQHTSYAYFLV